MSTTQTSKTLLLNDRQVSQRIDRLAFQIYEDNSSEKEIVIAGIMKSGYELAERIATVLESISPLKVVRAKLFIDKHTQVAGNITLSISKEELQGKVIILVDDVLNSGKTIMYAMKPFLEADIKKIRTVVLVDRNHKRFPVSSDYAGITLSTTLQEHVTVEFTKEGTFAWLS